MKYEFVDGESHKHRVPLRITEEGEYKDLKFVYGTIKFVEVNEEDDDSEMGLNFLYEIIENPNNVEETQELIDIMGNILVDVLDSEMQDIGEGEFLRQG